jgi:ABC-2 type transport system ATP-binding protein
MSATAIEFESVQKSFGLTFSLGPLTLSVPRGSIYALIGPNGAGKSTALNMLMGMGEPALGNIRVLGRNMREDEVEIKRRTAYVSPDMDYRAWGTVGRAIDFVRGFYPDWNAARCEELQFAFGVHRDARVDALSFGARMKLALVLLCRETQNCWCWTSPRWASMPSRAVSCSPSCSSSCRATAAQYLFPRTSLRIWNALRIMRPS